MLYNHFTVFHKSECPSKGDLVVPLLVAGSKMILVAADYYGFGVTEDKHQAYCISRTNAQERSEFLAIYGRRRVGKSFLIEEAFENKLSFMAVGLYQRVDENNEDKIESYRQKQLAHFYESLIEYGRL